LCFFFNDTATTEIYTLSLHDALPILPSLLFSSPALAEAGDETAVKQNVEARSEEHTSELQSHSDLVCRLLLEKITKSAKDNSTHIRDHGGRVSACDVLVIGSLSASSCWRCGRSRFFFFNDTATTEIYTLSLHDALPI